MRVLITGTSSGIGLATAKLFLDKGHVVVGLDIKPSALTSWHYRHHICDVSKKEKLPCVGNFDIIINNAGTIDEKYALSTNVEGYINVIEKYASSRTTDIVNVASISGHVGLDTMRYAASQGARLALTKHLSISLGKKWGTRVNSVSPGAVMTGLEPRLYSNEKLVHAVANENILHKWIAPEEIAEWIYFLAVVNKSMTGQDVLVDNGECQNFNFISEEGK